MAKLKVNVAENDIGLEITLNNDNTANIECRLKPTDNQEATYAEWRIVDGGNDVSFDSGFEYVDPEDPVLSFTTIHEFDVGSYYVKIDFDNDSKDYYFDIYEGEDEDTEVIYLVVSNLTSEFVKVSLSGKIFKAYVKCELGICNSNKEIVVKADLVSITPDNIEEKYIQCNTLVGGEEYKAYLHRLTPTGDETLAETSFVAPSISVKEITENSAEVLFYGTKSPEYWRLDIYLNDGESADTYQATIWSLPHEYLFENLDKNKEYTVKLTPYGFDNVLIAQATFRVGGIPGKFDWTIKKTSGEYIRVSAAEWNAFLDHVNTVRVYCGLDKASFNNVTAHTLTGRNVVTKAEVDAGVVSKNSLICYDNIRDVVDAILGKDGKYMGIGVPSEYESLINIQKGDRISADFFNNLRDAVNSVLK